MSNKFVKKPIPIEAYQWFKNGDHPKDYEKEVEDGDQDWATPCENCEQLPTVHPVGLCGPCCFGEADTAGGNW